MAKYGKEYGMQRQIISISKNSRNGVKVVIQDKQEKAQVKKTYFNAPLYMLYECMRSKTRRIKNDDSDSEKINF